MKADGKRLLIRTDAGVEIGTGHVMRCLALAQAWQDEGGQTVFLLGDSIKAIEERLQTEGMLIRHVASPKWTLEDAKETAEIAKELDCRCIVLDGYHFPVSYQSEVKQSGKKLMVIDDNGENVSYCADLILNQNVHATEDMYQSRPEGSKLLLGPRYILLRREFRNFERRPRKHPNIASKILVTCGGSDPGNQTLRILKELQRVTLDKLVVKVVIGGGSPCTEALAAFAKNCDFSCKLFRNATNMSQLMDWADMAVSAAGSTCWELAFMGVPTVLLVVADNQRHIAEGLSDKGACLIVDDMSSLECCLNQMIKYSSLRTSLAQTCKCLLDSQGPARVINHLLGDT